MLLLLLQNLDLGGSPVGAAVGAGSGDDVRASRKKKGKLPVIPWRDPLYATADLQRDLTESEYDPDEAAQSIVGESVRVFDGSVRGGLVTLPAPPRTVSDALLAQPTVRDFSDVLSAIKDAHRRERSRAERQRIMEYRVHVERVRRTFEKRMTDEKIVEKMLVEGWL